MISETEALERVLTAVDPGPVESVPLAEADGRWLRESLAATVPLPSFDNSAMDGYAISASDCGQTDRWLEIIGEVAAGQAPSLHENSCAQSGCGHARLHRGAGSGGDGGCCHAGGHRTQCERAVRANHGCRDPRGFRPPPRLRSLLRSAPDRRRRGADTGENRAARVAGACARSRRTPAHAPGADDRGRVDRPGRTAAAPRRHLQQQWPDDRGARPSLRCADRGRRDCQRLARSHDRSPSQRDRCATTSS